MPDLTPWAPAASATAVDVNDRAARLLGHVAVDGTADISDRAARQLGVADLSDRAARLLGHVAVDGTADISDRAARLLGHVAVDGTADIGDRAGRALGQISPAAGATFDVADRGARRVGAVTPPLGWSITHQAGGGVQATTTRAAGGAGIRHVCTAIIASHGNQLAAAAHQVDVVLRDGASGAGTILASFTLVLDGTAGRGDRLAIPHLFIPGTANTAMTLEFAAAPTNANILQRVTLVGYDTDTI